MFTTKIKFALLAAACLIAGAPIIGSLQREAAPRPQPPIIQRSFRFSAREYQRAALHRWLVNTLGAESVEDLDDSRSRMRVLMPPATPRDALLGYARSLVSVLNLHFPTDRHSPVREVDLHSDRADLAIVRGGRQAGSYSVGWIILEQGKAIQ